MPDSICVLTVCLCAGRTAESQTQCADTPGQSMAHDRLKIMVCEMLKANWGLHIAFSMDKPITMPFPVQILTGKFINHARLLKIVPTTRLLEIRALLLERLGRHHEALR